MRALPFNVFSKLSSLVSDWTNLSVSLTEGVSMSNGEIGVNFKEDGDRDVIKLVNPKPLTPAKKEGVPVFRGFYLERVPEKEGAYGDGTKSFMSEIKKWGAISDENLSQLIALTFPQKLADSNVKLIFVSGSSDPLAARIAETLKRDYYPNCKIIDVMKKYYGIDPMNIIDWEKYDKADPVTQHNLDVYLKQFSSTFTRTGVRIPPKSEFSGYIKKSAGLQSGGRRLLKAGHEMDEWIIQNIQREEEDWVKNYLNDPKVTQSLALKNHPTYLFVDDTIIEGSTLRGIFKEMLNMADSSRFNKNTGEMVKRSIFGYCLFSWKA